MASSFSMAESPVPQPRASSSPRSTSSRDWEELASALLEDGLILTALELHTELLECCGRDVPSLREYFSNPGNFEHTIPQPPSGLLGHMVRTASLSTFDSIELGRYSDDGERDAEDRVAVLEFELRKAYDTIKSLRGSLTEATEISGDRDAVAKIKPKFDEAIKPHEKRALNFLSHEYLMQQDNKLTAITFTEENGDQDFDDWDDVGLDIAKPPDLLYLFRNYSTCALSDKEKIDRITQLEEQVGKLTAQSLAVQRENEALQLRLKRMSVSDDSGRRLHRRSSSLVEHPAELKEGAVKKMQKLGHSRNQSSPDPLSDCQPDGTSSSAPDSQEPRPSGSDAEDKLAGTSTKSDLTLSGDDAETVVNEKSSLLTAEEEEEEEEGGRGDTLLREHSISSTTLQNERTEGEGGDGGEGGEGGRLRISVAFRQELLNTAQLRTDSRIGLEVERLNESALDLVQLLGRSLPHIVPNVILAKREELIPVLLCVVSRHPDGKVRDQLLNMMFNLIKRPDRGQRHVIMSGCVSFAKMNGTTRVESELLPQMWEQITHKHYERRLLVAEACGVLAPYIPAELRGSLVLSMLQQMLAEDKAESVRQAVARSLAVLVAFTDDQDKFKQCWEMLLKALRDPSQLVVGSVYSVLLPSVAAWAFELGMLESSMLSYFLHQLLTCIKQVFRSDGVTGAVEQSLQKIAVLTHLVPWHFALMLSSAPFAEHLPADAGTPPEVTYPRPASPLLDLAVIVGGSERLALLVQAFQEELISTGFSPWPALEWFQTEYLDKFLRVSVALGFSQPELVHGLATLLHSYCAHCGHLYTHRVVRPFFERSLALPKHNPGAALAEGLSQLTSAVLPIYVSGVLACFPKDERELLSYLRGVVVDMALYFGPLDSLKATVAELHRQRHYHPLLASMLRDLSTHSSFQVRRYVAALLGLLVKGVEEKLVTKSVLPLLIKLARDSEIAVCVDTVASFGTIMETATSKEVLVRVHEQFEGFMSGGGGGGEIDHQILMAVLRTLAKIGPHADPVFRDDFIIPRLSAVAVDNNSAANLTKRRDVCLALLDAYRNISECSAVIGVDLLTAHVLPGLQSLLVDVRALEPDQLEAVQQLVASCNGKISEHQRQEGPPDSADSKSAAGNFFSKLRPPFDKDAISPSKFFKKKS